MPCARRQGNAGAGKNSVARHKHRTGIPGGGGGGGSCRPSSSSSLLISRRSSFVVDDQQRPGLQGSDSRDNCESGSASRRRSRRRNKRNICSSSSCSFRINCPTHRWSSSGSHSSSSRMRNSWLITMFLFYGVFQKGEWRNLIGFSFSFLFFCVFILCSIIMFDVSASSSSSCSSLCEGHERGVQVLQWVMYNWNTSNDMAWRRCTFCDTRNEREEGMDGPSNQLFMACSVRWMAEMVDAAVGTIFLNHFSSSCSSSPSTDVIYFFNFPWSVLKDTGTGRQVTK